MLNKASVGKEKFVSIFDENYGNGLSNDDKFAINNAHIFLNSDYCLIQILSRPYVPNILKFIGVDSIGGTFQKCTLMMYDKECNYEERTSSCTIVDKLYQYKDHDEIMLNKTIQYDIETQPGDCGAPTIISKGNCHAICGIHVAFDHGANKGLSTLLDKNDIVKAIEQMNLERVVLIDKNKDKFCGATVSDTEIVPQLGGIVNPKFLSDVPDRHFVNKLCGSGQIIGYSNNFKTGQYKSNVRMLDRSIFNSFYSDLLVQWPECVTNYYAPELRAGWLHERDLQGYIIEQPDGVGTYVDPYYESIQHSCEIRNDINVAAVEHVAKAFCEYMIEELEKGPKVDNLILNDYEALNGVPSLAYVDGMNLSTSTGFPDQCVKRECVISAPRDGYPDGVWLNEYYQNMYDDIKKKYCEYGTYNHVFTVCLKDEPVKSAKVGKTRVFSCGMFAWNLLVRKYFLKLSALMHSNNFIFKTAVGVNCFSEQWDNMYRYLFRDIDPNELRAVAGDFKKYDKKMSSIMIRYAYLMLLNLLTHYCDLTADDYKILYGIMHDSMFPILFIHGVFFRLFGSNVSGHVLTVDINSLVNVLYMMYVWIMVGYKVKDFFIGVRMLAYGDDNVLCLHKSVLGHFNFLTIESVLAGIGVEYTTADKQEISELAIAINEVDFLKRQFYFDSDVNRYIAPLDKKSIVKMLLFRVHTNKIDVTEQIFQIVQSALMESSLHEEEWYNYILKWCKKIVVHYNLEYLVSIYPFLTYKEKKYKTLNII
jgi:hypothetical protein